MQSRGVAMKKSLFLGCVSLALFVGCVNQEGLLPLKGAIYMKGSTPHTYLVLENEANQKKYRLRNAKAFALEKRQNQVVSLKVKVLKEGSGAFAPTEVEVIEAH